mmetsp:Transcript_19689/g.66187  ORF Transcript_19689/g.66187 Transcript_19689/m.66187 type:complete len:427 (+) Transcript_19689:192-1472(+)
MRPRVRGPRLTVGPAQAGTTRQQHSVELGGDKKSTALGGGAPSRLGDHLVDAIPCLDINDSVWVRTPAPVARLLAAVAHVLDRGHRRDGVVPGGRLAEDLHLLQGWGVHVHGDGGLRGAVLNGVNPELVVGVRLRGPALLADGAYVRGTQGSAAPDSARGICGLPLEELLVHLWQLVLHLDHLALHGGHKAGALVVAVDGGTRSRRPAHEETFHVLVPEHDVARVLGRVVWVPVHEALVLLPPREPLCELVAHGGHVVVGVVPAAHVGLQEAQEGGEAVRLGHERALAVEGGPSLGHEGRERRGDPRGDVLLELCRLKAGDHGDNKRRLAAPRVAHAHVADAGLHVVELEGNALHHALEGLHVVLVLGLEGQDVHHLARAQRAQLALRCRVAVGVGPVVGEVEGGSLEGVGAVVRVVWVGEEGRAR